MELYLFFTMVIAVTQWRIMDIAPSTPIITFYKYSPILSPEESHDYFDMIASFKET